MDKPVSSMSYSVLTVGHSTLSYEQFLSLIRSAGVTAIADVRSAPYSRHFPHFNREALRDELKADGVAYVFLGDELGGRPKESAYFCEGVADYEKMATAPAFASGIKRVKEGVEKYRIALMCSEHSPLDCHRCLLVGRALHEQGISVGHITTAGTVRGQTEIEDDLRTMAGDVQDQVDFFVSPSDRLAEAYRLRSRRVAYAEAPMAQSKKMAAG
jgi:uncharacterized protein (DUF488 family)